MVVKHRRPVAYRRKEQGSQGDHSSRVAGLSRVHLRDPGRSRTSNSLNKVSSKVNHSSRDPSHNKGINSQLNRLEPSVHQDLRGQTLSRDQNPSSKGQGRSKRANLSSRDQDRNRLNLLKTGNHSRTAIRRASAHSRVAEAETDPTALRDRAHQLMDRRPRPQKVVAEQLPKLQY